MKPADRAHTFFFFMYNCMFQLDALEYIHENSYVHADVKASNCLLGYKAGKSDSDVVCINPVFDKSGLLLAKFFIVQFVVGTHKKHLTGLDKQKKSA